jgi:formylglycine-generating enzyme required for sulfatase activity
MKRSALLIVTTLVLLASAAFADPTVSNVTASQRQDGTKLVDVSYDVAETLGDWPYITLKVSIDGGATYAINATAVTGDVMRNIEPGTGKHIVWDAKVDVPDMSGNNFRAQVVASTCTGYSGPMISIPAYAYVPGVLLYHQRGTDVGPCKSADNGPAQSLTMSAYKIGKYEVTRSEYSKFVEAGGYSTQSYWSTDGWAWKTANSRTQPQSWASQQNWGTPPGVFTQTGRHPVIGVTYYEAEAYCNWASTLLPAGESPYHLPSEAQWENAARGGYTTSAIVYPWGDTPDPQKCNGHYDSAYPGSQTAPVGSYPSGASPYGCMDMAGNAMEWCKDWYSATYYADGPLVDPPGPASGTTRILRGGHFMHAGPPDDCYLVTYSRLGGAPTAEGNEIGFRMAR